MNISKHILALALVLIFSLSSCKDGKTDKKAFKISESISTDLKVDHFNIWVENPEKPKKLLNDIGFTSVPDSLSMVHSGQGTSGRYFHFLNGYLELIFVYDQNELEKNNEKNKALDFTKRANFQNNGASPFSIALKLKEYDLGKIPFEKVKYHQDWMEENVNIYSAKNSKINLNEPSIFVIYPEIESGTFESLTELESFPSEDDSWKEFYKHPNGAQKITAIKITSNGLNLNTKTVKVLNEIKNLTVISGTEHVMELYFDSNIQGKSFDLRPELPLIIYL